MHLLWKADTRASRALMLTCRWHQYCVLEKEWFPAHVGFWGYMVDYMHVCTHTHHKKFLTSARPWRETFFPVRLFLIYPIEFLKQFPNAHLIFFWSYWPFYTHRWSNMSQIKVGFLGCFNLIKSERKVQYGYFGSKWNVSLSTIIIK